MGRKAKLLDIEKELKKQLKPAVKQTAIDLNQMLEDAFEMVVYAFYMDYTPKYYNRTWSTYEASNLYDNEWAIENPRVIGENTYEAGLTVSPFYIPGEPYKKGKSQRPDKNWVFNRTYRLGIHGVSASERHAWGKNKYWQTYLKYIKKLDSKHTLNQYKNIRNKTFGKSKIKSEDFGSSLQQDKTYIAAAKIFGWKLGKNARILIADTYRYGDYQMVGKGNKPIYIMEKNYKRITNQQNIRRLIMDNIIYMLSK